MFNMLKGNEPGLVGFWGMDGNLNDGSPLHNHGTAEGSVDFVPVFHAVWAEGKNSYSYCAIGSSTRNLERLRALQQPGAPGPSPLPEQDRLSQVQLTSAAEMARSLCHVDAPQARLLYGRLTPSGTLRLQFIAQDDGPHYIGWLELGPEGSSFRVTTWVVCSATHPLNEWSWNESKGGHAGLHQVWTQNGWQPFPEGKAEAFDNLYWYRVILGQDSLKGANAISLRSSDEAELTFYTAPLVQRTQSITVQPGAPVFHASLMTSLDNPDFPLGAVMVVRNSRGEEYHWDMNTHHRFVKAQGNSVWHLVARDPYPGDWHIIIEAPQNVAFHLQIQTLPSTDMLATIQAALGPIYSEKQIAARMLYTPLSSIKCGVCTVAMASMAALVTLAVVTVGITMAVAGGPFTAALTSLLGAYAWAVAVLITALAGFGIRQTAETFCRFLGACADTGADLRRLLDGDYRYDQYCYLMAHNAFSYQGLIKLTYAQQSGDIAWQLDHGVDGLMFDTYVYAPAGKPREVYLCHQACDGYRGFITNPDGQPLTLAQGLAPVVECLKKDPRRILTIYFECRVGQNAALVQQAFDQAGATPLLFYADRPNQGPHGTWNVGTQGWPTRKWMIENNKRLVVLSDRAAETWSRRQADGSGVPRDNDGLPYVWQYAVESVYGDDSLNPEITRERGGSSPLNDTQKPLFILNHFPSWSVGGLYPALIYPRTNRYGDISAQVERYTRSATRLPNFLAVDYFEMGLDGGPLRAAGDINRRWAEKWR